MSRPFFSRVANLTRVQYAGAILVHRVANKVDKSADFCPQMGNEHPQRAGKNASQAKFAILVFLAYGHGRARGVEPQGLTDPPMMGWDTRKLRALWLL